MKTHDILAIMPTDKLQEFKKAKDEKDRNVQKVVNQLKPLRDIKALEDQLRTEKDPAMKEYINAQIALNWTSTQS